MVKWVATAVAMYLLGSLAGCASPEAGPAAKDRRFVIVQAPPGLTESLSKSGSFRNPYPPASRVAVWDADDPERAPRVLSRGLSAAGAPAISPDGERVLFCGRKEHGKWGIFEARLPDGRARRITPEHFHALHPAYLAGERIVFSADREGTTDPHDGGSSFSLYTCRLDGSELDRITFNPGSDIEPSVLRDGRVLYSGWQPPSPERPRGGWALFTIVSDGTGMLPFYGSHDAAAERHACELPDRRVGFLVATSEPGAFLATVSLARPLRTLERPPLAGSCRSISPASESELIVSLRSREEETPGTTYGLSVWNPEEGTSRSLYDDPEYDELEAVAARPGIAPRGHVPDMKPGAPSGTLLCLDAARTDRAGAKETRLPADRLRIYRALPSRTSAGPNLKQELLAELPLAADGSVLADVPADTPLRFETVDSAGAVLLDSKGWVWVRPGEKRACIGCHEDRESAPGNRFPLALRSAPDSSAALRIALGESAP